MKALIIAAPMSGAGKTTVTIGLMECFRRRGLRVAPFKVGPDFIDPGYHAQVTGRPSINLDGWMCSADYVRHEFLLNAANADIAVIEGVMGLFDGIGGHSDEGSTAQIARILSVPVVLLVDAKGMARSAGAIVKGFSSIDPEVRISGVIFNNVASDNHARILKEAVKTLTQGIPVIGCIPRDPQLQIPSRHLGLVTAGDNPLSLEFLDHLADIARTNINLGMLWQAATPGDYFTAPNNRFTFRKPAPSVRIAVARDPAFCFCYETNIELLKEAGAEIVYFSPLQDSSLPETTGGIYLPGGYPELFADRLAANEPMKRCIREAIETGMPVYAECGGFIYLSKGVQDEGQIHGFVNIFPVVTTLLPRRKSLGYREVEFRAATPIARKGMKARGHEFHYSEMEEMPKDVKKLYRVRGGRGHIHTEGYRYKNCLASYIHLHFGSCPEMARVMVENCGKWARKQKTGLLKKQ